MQTTIDSSTLAPLLARLTDANEQFLKRFPGAGSARQPIHTVYGGANLYKAGAAEKLGGLALKHMQSFAANTDQFAVNLGLAVDDPLVPKVYERVMNKLAQEPIEDHRVDFEDGYGTRSNDEEDGHVQSAASAMATGLLDGSLPRSVGIRIKALS